MGHDGNATRSCSSVPPIVGHLFQHKSLSNNDDALNGLPSRRKKPKMRTPHLICIGLIFLRTTLIAGCSHNSSGGFIPTVRSRAFFGSARKARGKGTETKTKTSKENLPSKICLVCGRPFSWRKKWERCWDEVTCCSKRCNSERRKGS